MVSLICTLLLGSVAGAPIQVDGDGYLRFAKDGALVYAKHAELTWKNGLVVSQDGDPVWPKIRIEQEPTAIQVDLKGRVTAIFPNGQIEAGRLVVALFPDDIRPVVSGNYLKLFGDGEPAEPGQGLAGVIRPWQPHVQPAGQAEQSYVKVHFDQDGEPESARTEITVSNLAARKTDYQGDDAWIAQGGIEIAFPARCQISGNTMALGDLADIFASPADRAALQKLDMGNPPVFGAPRTYDRNWVIAQLKGAGYQAAKIRIIGPVRLTIERIGQTVTQKMFEEAATAGIASQYPDFEPESAKPVPDLQAPAGKLELIVEGVAKSGKSLSVTVAAYIDGKRINSRTLLFTNAAAPISVKPGDEVTVCVQSGSVQIESTGKVKKVDPVSGQVTVELSTGKTLVGRWTKSGKVEVKL